MGFSFRKSIKLGPARINLSKSGVGYSIGAGGVRYTKSPQRKSVKKNTGKKTTTTRKTPKQEQSALSAAADLTTYAAASIKKSWFAAIFFAILSFVLAVIISFIAILIACFIASIFIRDFLSTIVANIIIFGGPLILAGLAARYVFLYYKPNKEDYGESN